jgi:PiT family inorganic phosphate transporter
MLPWDTISQIALGWVVSPIISAVTAWVVFRFIQAFIFSCDDPLGRVIFMAPICMAVILMVFLRIVLIGVAQSSYVYGVFVLSVYAIDLVVFSMGPIAYFFTRFWLSSYISVAQDNQSVMLSTVERVFAVLVVMTASVMAFSHGANDVANAIGPMVSALNILRSGNVEFMGVVPIWIMLWGALGVAIGVSTYGYKVMQRVGNDITTLSPSRSFAAQLATGIVVLSASHLGFPVSTTQILVGGVMGVGLARGLAAIDLSVVKGIFLSWLITIPSGAMLSIVIYRIFEIVL